MTNNQYDVIVVGAGHAGCEAALASARLGAKTLLLTINLDMVAFMPCNPSIGGPAKGIVVREIDALGGEMGRNIDKTYIQMRMLNTAKGPAVRALRAQADKYLYQFEMKSTIENQSDLDLKQALVDKLIVEDKTCKGVITQTGEKYFADSVVITTGTYLNSEIIIGEVKYSSGPNNALPSINLTKHMQELGLTMVRFKTGTPPRVHGETINYDKTEIQPGDEIVRRFSFDNIEREVEQLPCWLTHTNLTTHQIIEDNLHKSPMYSGMIKGTGPRYCPSIEDKIVRFNDKSRHQIFLEPEALNTHEVYVQGLSSSLPEEVQRDMIASIEGLENAKMMRPGYAIEYDSVVPTQLWPTLETKLIPGLFTAGQINGTSGYEEAAGQGLIAGINAAKRAKNDEQLVLGREQGYIGLLIDDLVTKGTNEPYRLLTSRSEYRLLLRHDNADLRLTEVGNHIGLVTPEKFDKFIIKKNNIESEIERLKNTVIKPTAEVQKLVLKLGGSELRDGIRAADFLKRTEVDYKHVYQLTPPENELTFDECEQVEIQIKYQGYIEKSLQQVDRLKRMEDKKIPKNIDYDAIPSLATEARQKLKEVMPLSVAQASRISGVNPADVAILLVYIEQGKIARID